MGPFLETPTQQTPQLGRNLRRKRVPVGLAGENPRQHLGGRTAAERGSSAEHLVQHAPERPDVGPSIRGLARRLLRAHVRRGPEQDARSGHLERPGRDVGQVLVDPRLLPRLGEAEVEDLDGPFGCDPDVGRLQVTVDDALVVGRPQSDRDLRGDLERLGDGQRARREAVAEILSSDELHDQEGPFPVRRRHIVTDPFDPVKRRHVRVVDAREQPRLALETGQSVPVGRELLREQLDGDVATETGVMGPVHLAHAAGTDRLLDAVVTEAFTLYELHPVSEERFP